MKFMNQIRRYVAAGTLATALTVGAVTTTTMVAMPTPAQAWTINGSEQPNIPFWYTLKEAVCAYLFGAQCDE